MNLEKWMEKEGITIREMAKKSKASTTSIWRIREGDLSVQIRILYQVLKATKNEVTLEDLMKHAKKRDKEQKKD